MSVSVELPKYRSHKTVWALKIDAVEFAEDGSAKIISGHTGYEAPAGWREKFHGSEDDLGYVVIYEDGYVSWSPAVAFEAGYTRV